MAVKINESLWTSVTRKLKLDVGDAALVKALAKVDKTDPSQPEMLQKTLEDLIDQVKVLDAALVKRKKEFGDKPVGELRDKLEQIRTAAQAQAKEAEAAASDREEADSPALLSSKMLPLLRELRKGEVRMHAMVCTAGKACAVLIQRRPVSPSRRKLLAEAVNASGGAKYIAAECLVENKVLTFVMQASAAGLAKRLRQALLDQTAQRMKVRVRGDDGEDEHGDPTDDAESERDDATPQAVSPTRTQAPAQAAAALDPQLQLYEDRMRALQPRLRAALADGLGDVSRIRAVADFAVGKSQEGNAKSALAALDALEKLITASEAMKLAQTHPPGPAPVASTDAAALAAAFKARLAGLLPRMRQALTEGGAIAEAVKSKPAASTALAKSADYAGANALLDELEQQLDEAEAEKTERRLRERVLVADADRAYADYLDLRDSSDNAAVVANRLSAAEAMHQAWQDEFGDTGDAALREQMADLAHRLQFEREALSDLIDQLMAIEALLAERDASSDEARVAELQAELLDALEDLPA